MKVLFAASEAVPFAKSGGLGDVVGTLPVELKKKNIDIRVVIPLYKSIAKEYRHLMKKEITFFINLNWRRQLCNVYSLEKDSVKFYFLENDYYFNRDTLYGYYDEAERYLFFAKAVLEFFPKVNFIPNIVHCNDWQTAIIPFLLNMHYREHYKNIKTVLTIHNIKYQGIYGKATMHDLLALKPDEITTDIEYNGNVNILKAGIYNANWVNTVSPTYANELQYDYFGAGLSGVIRDNKYKISGILNGIDYDTNSPEHDRNIYVNYKTSLEGKHQNKRLFIQEMDLSQDESRPLVGVVSRLDELKGIDLISCVIYEMMQLGINIVVLGTGEKKYEDVFKNIKNSFPNNASINIMFDSKLASRIYAASDIFLMPSRIEPCGLSQMIALKYGAVPLVRKTGGLNDTVKRFDSETGTGNGFVFTTYNSHEMLSELSRAVDIFKNNKNAWSKLVSNAFATRYDWSKSADEYKAGYEKVIC